MTAKHILKIVVQATDRRTRKDVLGDVQDMLDAGFAAIRPRVPSIIDVRVMTGIADVVGKRFSNRDAA